MKRSPKLGKDKLIIVNLSGRGDKDVSQVAEKVGLQMPK
jgi:tryptophan synthase beta subunit